MNNYIVTFEYRVMVTAFAILVMFEVGPSVKFVSAIKDEIFNKRSEGGLAKDQTFSGFSFVQPSLIISLCYQLSLSSTAP